MARRRLWQKHWPDHDALKVAVDVTVPFQDADPTGVAWHGNYFRYYDAARVALLARLNFGYREMAGAAQLWPIVDTRVRYLHALPYGQTVQVSAQLVEWEFRMRIYYQIIDAEQQLANEAFTLQVPVDVESNSIVVGSPQRWLDRVQQLIDESP